MSFLKKLFKKEKKRKERFLVEVSLGRGKYQTLGFVECSEDELFEKVMELLKSHPECSRIKYYRITFPDGRREKFENPFFEGEAEEEEEEEEEIEVRGRRRKKKSIEDLIDPYELLKDTVVRLKKAHAIVLEETIKMIPSVMKGLQELYISSSKDIVYSAIKDGIREAISIISEKLKESKTTERSDETMKLLLELVRLRAMEKEKKIERRRSIKVEREEGK